MGRHAASSHAPPVPLGAPQSRCPHPTPLCRGACGQMPNLVSVESDPETDDEEEETEEGGDWQARRLLPCASGAPWRAALPRALTILFGGACGRCQAPISRPKLPCFLEKCKRLEGKFLSRNGANGSHPRYDYTIL